MTNYFLPITSWSTWTKFSHYETSEQDSHYHHFNNIWNKRHVQKVTIHHVQADREKFYAYCGNTAVDLDPLPVIRGRLTVVEPALFEWDVFEMATPIQSPAKCEVRSVIRFLNSKSERPGEIHKQTVAVYGNVMNFHLFLHLKKHLAGKKFDDDDEMKVEVMTWFKEQAADFYGSGIQRLVPRLNERLR